MKKALAPLHPYNTNNFVITLCFKVNEMPLGNCRALQNQQMSQISRSGRKRYLEMLAYDVYLSQLSHNRQYPQICNPLNMKLHPCGPTQSSNLFH